MRVWSCILIANIGIPPVCLTIKCFILDDQEPGSMDVKEKEKDRSIIDQLEAEKRT
jgi:hypothetical protein